MQNKDVIAAVTEYLQPTVRGRGCEIYDAEFVKEGQNRYFRVYIDKAGGVAVEDCEAVSRAAEKFLDEKDIIEQAYILEVSSAGLDRPLKKEADFARYAGEIVDVKLYKPRGKRKEFQGTLKGLEGDEIVITDESGEIRFARAEVASCRLAVIL